MLDLLKNVKYMISKSSLGNIILFLYILLLFSLFVIPFHVMMPRVGLDPSWQQVICYAIRHNWQFGKDVIFTWGPLGTYGLHFVYPSDYLKYILVRFIISIIISISVFQIVKNFKVTAKILVPFGIFISLAVIGGNLFFVVQLLIVVLIVKSISKLNCAIVYLLVILMAFSVLVKFLYFPTSILLVMLTDIYIFLKNRSFKYLSLTFICSIIFFFIASGQHIENLLSYFIGSFQLSSGYSWAMQIKGPNDILILFLSLSFFLFFYLIRDLIKEKNSTQFYIFISFSLLWFIGFKEGFVRFDGHAMFAWGILCSLVLLLYVIKRFSLNFSLLISVFLFAIIVKAHYLHTEPLPLIKSTYTSYVKKFKNMPFILSSKHLQLISVNFKHAQNKITKNYPLIGLKGTVDIYPWNAAIVIANKLQYRPRPIFQSYIVYTKWLIEKNREFLENSRAPTYLLFRIGTIDYRFPNTMEGWSWLYILNRYKIVSFAGNYILLKRRKKTKDIFHFSRKKQKAVIGFNEKIILPFRFLWCNIKIKPTLIGKFLTTMFKAPILHIKVTYYNGREAVYRIVPKITKEGFILSPQINKVRTFALLSMSPEIIPNANFIKSIEIKGNSIDKIFYSNRITITFLKILYNKKYNMMGRIGNHFGNLNKKTDLIGHIDRIWSIKNGKKYFKIRGWIFNKVKKSIPKKLLILNEKNIVIGYALSGLTRKDVSRVIDKKALLSGFVGYVNKNYCTRILKILDMESKSFLQVNIGSKIKCN